MYNLDFMLNGQLSRERYLDRLQKAQHKRLVRKVKVAQRTPKTVTGRPGITHRYAAALLTLWTSLFRS